MSRWLDHTLPATALSTYSPFSPRKTISSGTWSTIDSVSRSSSTSQRHSQCATAAAAAAVVPLALSRPAWLAPPSRGPAASSPAKLRLGEG